MKFTSKKFEELTAAELYEIMRARNEIFVIEQNCIYQDCDDCDYGYHVFSTADAPGTAKPGAAGTAKPDAPVTAYMRIYEIQEETEVVEVDGQAIWADNAPQEKLKDAKLIAGGALSKEANAGRKTVQMGRVLTIKHGEGLGGRLLEEGIKTAWEKMGADRIFIEAETYVIGYYEKYGFTKLSDEFLKDGIPHVQMELIKYNSNSPTKAMHD